MIIFKNYAAKVWFLWQLPKNVGQKARLCDEQHIITSNLFNCLVPDNDPRGGIVEHGLDNLPTLLLGEMWRPACPRSHHGVACIPVQSLGISVQPVAECYPFSPHLSLNQHCRTTCSNHKHRAI